MSDKTVILTVLILPPANGKRKVIVSGAPEKEMPVVRLGTFAERHALEDAVWLELMKREPQLVTVKVEKSKPATKPTAEDQSAEGATENSESAELSGAASPDAQLVAEAETAQEQGAEEHVIEHDWAVGEVPGAEKRDVPVEPEQLPMIEGDLTSNSELPASNLKDEVTNG